MATKIQLRRDTSSSWTSTNPVLAQGEPGVETDTGKFKIGDGTTAWASLNYASNGTSTTSGQFINIVAGISAAFPLVNSVSIDGDNWTAPIVVSAYYGAGQEYWQFETYSLAIGNGKVVYLVYGDWPWNSGIATAETALDSPQLQTQECTYVTPDSNKYSLQWNSLEFTGGYFVACGYYYNGTHDVPCFAFSTDGENWTWGNVDNTTFIPGLISAESGDANLIGIAINSASYNGVGWLLTLAWQEDGSPVGTPSNAGAFYITSLSQACNSSTHISTGGAQYQYGAIAWTGSAWVGTDSEQNIFTNTSLNPAQGSWTTTSIATAQLAAFGDSNSSVQTVVTPVGTLNGHNYWILGLEDGRLLATKDAGATWQGFVPIPSYDYITGFTSGSTTITVTNELNSNRVIITGLPSGTFGTGASGLTGGSGTFYVNSTGNPSSGALYSDVGLSQAVTSGASFSSITTTLSQNTLGDDRSVVVTSTTGILIGMAITFASSPTLDDGSPNIVTAVDTTNNIVTFSNMLVDILSSGHSVTFAPAVTYSTGFPVYELCYGNGKLVAVATPGPYLTFLSTKDLVTWNYTFGSNFTDWLDGPWDENIFDDAGFYSTFYSQIAYGDVGNVNNLLTSNNALGSPNVSGNPGDEFYLPHSQQSGLMNSLSLGSALNVNVFGIGAGGTAGVNQGYLTVDPNNGYWQLGMGTVYGYGQYETNLSNLSSIGNSNYWSSQENEVGLPDIYISVGGNGDTESTWWFAAQYEPTERPSTLVIPYNGVIGIRNNDSGTDNVITVTYYDDLASEPNIAIGPQAGANPAGGNMIAIGYEAGKTYQDDYAIALGARAGKFGQGAGAIAIGAFAAGAWGDSGTAQAANSIIINATANHSQPLYDAGANTLVIKPVRNAVGPTSLYYNSSTGEITYAQVKTGTPANSDFSTNAVPKASADGNWTFSIGSTTGILTVTNSSSGTLSQAYTITYFIAGVATVVNATSSPVTTASISLSAGNSALVLANPGDYAQTIFQDLTSNTVYRVTFTVQSSTTGGIIVEQLI